MYACFRVEKDAKVLPTIDIDFMNYPLESKSFSQRVA